MGSSVRVSSVRASRREHRLDAPQPSATDVDGLELVSTVNRCPDKASPVSGSVIAVEVCRQGDEPVVGTTNGMPHKIIVSLGLSPHVAHLARVELKIP